MTNAAATTELTAVARSPSLPTFFDNLDSFFEAPDRVDKLRELILQLAVSGRLVESDEDSNGLRSKIEKARDTGIKATKIRRHPKTPEVERSEFSLPIPDRWLATRLGDLTYSCKTHYGENPSPDLTTVGVIKVGNVHNTNGYFKGDFAERGFSADDLDDLLCEEGDLIVVKSSGSAENVHSGKSALCSSEHHRKIVGSNFVMRLRRFRGDHVLPEFLWLVLISRMTRGWVEQTVQTMTYPNLKWSDYSQLPIPLPPLSEQRRIVSKVDGLMSLCDELEARGSERVRLRERASRSSLDCLVSSRSHRDLSSAWQRLSGHFEVLYDTPETLAHLRQSILQLAVQGKLVPQDANDEPAFELVNRVTAKRQQMLADGKLPKRKALTLDENGGPLFDAPTGWAWTHFDEIADIAGGVTKGRKLQGRETEWYPYLRVANVQRWHLDLDVMKDIEIPVNELEKYRLQKGDLVLTEGGDWDKLGRTAIWQGEIENCLHQNHVFRAQILDDDIDRRWIMLFTNSRVGRGYFENASKKTTNLASINMTQLRSCPIPLPPLAEQKRIVAKVDQLLSQCDELSARLRERQSATHGLLTATIHNLLNNNSN